MFDIGWSEILIIAIATILLIGPKELPSVMRQIAYFIRRLGALKTSILQQVNSFIEEDDGPDKGRFLPELLNSGAQTEIVKNQSNEYDQTIIPLPQSKQSDEIHKTKQATG